MRFLLVVFFFLTINTETVQSQVNAQLLFDQANTLLEQGNFAEALESYRDIENSGQVSGALFLNMGIAASQLDSMGLAKYYFLKSSEFTGTGNRAAQALEYVNSQFSRQSAMLPKLPWDRAVDWLKDGPGAVGVFLIGIVLIFSALIILLAKWFTGLTFTKFNLLLSSLTIAGFLIILIAFYTSYVEHRYEQAVIIENQVQVRVKPDNSADLVSLGFEGYSITVDQKLTAGNEDWYYIRLGNGQFGWIPAKGAKIL